MDQIYKFIFRMFLELVAGNSRNTGSIVVFNRHELALLLDVSFWVGTLF